MNPFKSGTLHTLQLAPAALVCDGARHDWPRPGAPWAREALREALARLPALPAGRRIEVEIDDAWARYQVVRTPKGLRGRDEREAWLAARFAQVFGADAGNWVLSAESAHFGLPALALALPRTLVEGVKTWAGERKLRLARLQPAFVAAYNRARPRLGGGAGVYALAGAGRLTAAAWNTEGWFAVRSQPCPAGDGQAATTLLAPMLVQLGVAEGSVFLDGRAPQPALPAGWRSVSLGGAA